MAELDTLLRNHQADTAARRLQLERALAQRQADLRSRTQEVEDLTERLREMERALEKSKLDMKGISSDALQKMEEKVAHRVMCAQLTELLAVVIACPA